MNIDFKLLKKQLEVIMQLVHYHEDYKFTKKERNALEGIENLLSELIKEKENA